MEIKYRALIFYDPEDSGYNVEFPDLPGCFTCGDSLDEAKMMAKDALNCYLSPILDDKEFYKLKSGLDVQLEGNMEWVKPDFHVAFPLWLRLMREGAGLSQLELAESLGIKQQSYSRLESSNANPTAKTLSRLQDRLGTRILTLQ